MFMMKLTALGAAKVAAAQAGGAAVTLNEFAVGDGNGAAVPAPTGGETNLAHEVWRGDISSLAVKAGAPTVVVAEAIIPTDEGGWAVRELGIFDDDGELFAYGNFPETWKPVAGDGATREMLINAELRVGAAANVTLVIDPALVTATRAWCLSMFLRIDQNLADVADPDEARENIGAAKVTTANPAALAGAPVVGVSGDAARADHRHQVPEIADIPGLTAALNGLVVTPIGGVVALAGAQDPRWLRCNGASYLQSAYPALFAQVGLLPRLAWTKRTAPASISSLMGLRYLNGNFVTLGYGASTASYYSSNAGVSWTAITGNLPANWRDMCWTGAKYVLVGDSTGANGITNSAALNTAFTARTSAFPNGTTHYAVASDGAGLVVAVGASGTVRAQYSTNHGDTWTAAVLPSAGNWQVHRIVYAAGRFVFAAFDQNADLSYIYTSTDGINWTLAANGFAGSYNYVTYVNGAWYAVGIHSVGYGVVAKSTNGTSWTVLSTPAYPMGNTNGILGLTDVNRSAVLPGGVLTFNGQNNFPFPGHYLYDDFRSAMQVAPPRDANLNAPVGISLAYGGNVLMLMHGSGYLHTTALYDYNTATEFVVPDLGPIPGAGNARYHIRGN